MMDKGRKKAMQCCLGCRAFKEYDNDDAGE
jgi:hypothetical protein